MTPDFYSFFLKGIIIVHELKTNFQDFQYQIFFNTLFILKTNSIFSTNCQDISCSILSQHGITSKHAHFFLKFEVMGSNLS